jgi:hypothetical protein
MCEVDEAKLKWIRFYDQLQQLLKRFQPIDYAPFVANRIKRCSAEPQLWAQTAPHHLLHSIEANCAYPRGQNHDPVTWNKLAEEYCHERNVDDSQGNVDLLVVH